MDYPVAALTDAQLTRAIQSCGDFQQALSAVTFLLEECDFAAKYSRVELRRFQCYESAAIVAFARPFEVARARTTIGLRALGVKLDSSEQELKSKIVGLRSQVIAHSDEECMHFKISSIHPFEDSLVNFPILIFQESLRLNASDMEKFEKLLRKLIRAISLTIFAIAQA